MNDEIAALVNVDFFDLKKGFYLISKEINRELEEDEFDDVFFSMVDCVAGELREGMTQIEKLEVYNFVFFNLLNIKCSPENDNISNYDPFRVMVNRVGLPLAVTFFYMLIARYVGVDFVISLFNDRLIPILTYNGKDLFFIDILNRGKTHNLVRPFRKLTDKEIIELYIERKTRIELATLSLGS
jgi:regulator of sirC expression with transglutaminase-like and TPR domain